MQSESRCRICGALFSSHDFMNEGVFRGVTREINGNKVFHYYEAGAPMITRTMQVEERNERVSETTFELRQKNPVYGIDDRMTIAINKGADMPPWAVGSYVTVTIEEEKE